MSKCLICHQNISRNLSLKTLVSFQSIIPETLCPRCRGEFQLSQDLSPRCPICDRVNHLEMCGDCQRWQDIYGNDLLRHESLYLYNEGMESWFKNYKFLGDYRLRKTFALELNDYFRKWSDWVIVPVPLSKVSYQKRGFNQVSELLVSGGQFFYPLLKKKTETLPQSSKNQQERLETPQPFQLEKEFLQYLPDKKILLVDDVYTTGRTLYHARDCLKDVRALEIRSFSLAR